jgi:hypothetical protein
MGDVVATVAAGLAIGVAFVAVFALVFNGAGVVPEEEPLVTITIPKDASIGSL